MIDLMNTELLDSFKVGDKVEVRFDNEPHDVKQEYLAHRTAEVTEKPDGSVMYIRYESGESDHIDICYDDFNDELYIASFKYKYAVELIPLDND